MHFLHFSPSMSHKQTIPPEKGDVIVLDAQGRITYR